MLHLLPWEPAGANHSAETHLQLVSFAKGALIEFFKVAVVDRCTKGSRMTDIVAQGRRVNRTQVAIREVLDGHRRGLSAIIPMVGPAVIVSIAYMDPGNFATNIQAGAKYGYGLLWVVLVANLIAMLFQSLSAKLGIATGRNLAEMCREQLPRPLVWAMWVASEIAAMATELAEFLGGAIGPALLFNLPLFWGMIVTAIVTYGILMFEKRGFRPIELIIGALVAIVCLCYLIEIFIAPVDWAAAAFHTFVPHAIYLHSGLTHVRLRVRDDADRRNLLRFSNREVIVALAIAGAVNMAMVMMASAAFHAGHSDVAEIETAYHALLPLLGAGAATVFLISLLASGVCSSAVGTMAGQMIMQGFVGFRIPIWVRRLVYMVPAFIVVGLGVNATNALVISQVILSLALPIPMIALLLFTQRPDIMGCFANGRATRVAAIAGTAVVLVLNTELLLQTFGVPLPSLVG